MGTVSVLAILAAGAAVIGGMAYAMLPRPEDYFERSMAELAELTTAPGRSLPASLAGGQDITAEHHLPGSGTRDVECPASPPTIIGSDRALLSGPITGPAADVQPIPPGGRVFFHSIEGCGVTAPAVRSRQPGVLFLVASK